jgi:hypothetical protein
MFLELLPVQKNDFLNTEVQNSAIEKIQIPLEALSELKKVVKFADSKKGSPQKWQGQPVLRELHLT